MSVRQRRDAAQLSVEEWQAKAARLRKRERYLESLECEERALHLLKDVFGPGHVDVVAARLHIASVCNTLGETYLNQGKTETGSFLLTKSFEMTRESWGFEDRRRLEVCAVALDVLSKHYKRRGETKAALWHFNQALDVVTQLGIPEDAVATRLQIASLLAGEGRHEDALACAKAALVQLSRVNKTKADDQDYCTLLGLTHLCLGQQYHVLGRRSDAETAIRRGHRLASAGLPRDSPVLQQLHDAFCAISDGRLDVTSAPAETWASQSATIRPASTPHDQLKVMRRRRTSRGGSSALATHGPLTGVALPMPAVSPSTTPVSPRPHSASRRLPKRRQTSTSKGASPAPLRAMKAGWDGRVGPPSKSLLKRRLDVAVAAGAMQTQGGSDDDGQADRPEQRRSRARIPRRNESRLHSGRLRPRSVPAAKRTGVLLQAWEDAELDAFIPANDTNGVSSHASAGSTTPSSERVDCVHVANHKAYDGRSPYKVHLVRDAWHALGRPQSSPGQRGRKDKEARQRVPAPMFGDLSVMPQREYEARNRKCSAAFTVQAYLKDQQALDDLLGESLEGAPLSHRSDASAASGLLSARAHSRLREALEVGQAQDEGLYHETLEESEGINLQKGRGAARAQPSTSPPKDGKVEDSLNALPDGEVATLFNERRASVASTSPLARTGRGDNYGRVAVRASYLDMEDFVYHDSKDRLIARMSSKVAPSEGGMSLSSKKEILCKLVIHLVQARNVVLESTRGQSARDDVVVGAVLVLASRDRALPLVSGTDRPVWAGPFLMEKVGVMSRLGVRLVDKTAGKRIGEATVDLGDFDRNEMQDVLWIPIGPGEASVRIVFTLLEPTYYGQEAATKAKTVVPLNVNSVPSTVDLVVHAVRGINDRRKNGRKHFCSFLEVSTGRRMMRTEAREGTDPAFNTPMSFRGLRPGALIEFALKMTSEDDDKAVELLGKGILSLKSVPVDRSSTVWVSLHQGNNDEPVGAASVSLTFPMDDYTGAQADGDRPPLDEDTTGDESVQERPRTSRQDGNEWRLADNAFPRFNSLARPAGASSIPPRDNMPRKDEYVHDPAAGLQWRTRLQQQQQRKREDLASRAQARIRGARVRGRLVKSEYAQGLDTLAVKRKRIEKERHAYAKRLADLAAAKEAAKAERDAEVSAQDTARRRDSRAHAAAVLQLAVRRLRATEQRKERQLFAVNERKTSTRASEEELETQRKAEERKQKQQAFREQRKKERAAGNAMAEVMQARVRGEATRRAALVAAEQDMEAVRVQESKVPVLQPRDLVAVLLQARLRGTDERMDCVDALYEQEQCVEDQRQERVRQEAADLEETMARIADAEAEEAAQRAALLQMEQEVAREKLLTGTRPADKDEASRLIQARLRSLSIRKQGKTRSQKSLGRHEHAVASALQARGRGMTERAKQLETKTVPQQTVPKEHTALASSLQARFRGTSQRMSHTCEANVSSIHHKVEAAQRKWACDLVVARVRGNMSRRNNQGGADPETLVNSAGSEKRMSNQESAIIIQRTWRASSSRTLSGAEQLTQGCYCGFAINESIASSMDINPIVFGSTTAVLTADVTRFVEVDVDGVARSAVLLTMRYLLAPVFVSSGATVAVIGGERLSVVFPSPGAAVGAAVQCSRILRAFNEQMKAAASPSRIRLSFGVASGPGLMVEKETGRIWGDSALAAIACEASASHGQVVVADSALGTIDRSRFEFKAHSMKGSQLFVADKEQADLAPLTPFARREGATVTQERLAVEYGTHVAFEQSALASKRLKDVLEVGEGFVLAVYFDLSVVPTKEHATVAKDLHRAGRIAADIFEGAGGSGIAQWMAFFDTAEAAVVAAAELLQTLLPLESIPPFPCVAVHDGDLLALPSANLFFGSAVARATALAKARVLAKPGVVASSRIYEILSENVKKGQSDLYGLQFKQHRLACSALAEKTCYSVEGHLPGAAARAEKTLVLRRLASSSYLVRQHAILSISLQGVSSGVSVTLGFMSAHVIALRMIAMAACEGYKAVAVVVPYGDRVLAAFPSAVGAVKAALECQAVVRELNWSRKSDPDLRKRLPKIGYGVTMCSGVIHDVGGALFGANVEDAIRLSRVQPAVPRKPQTKKGGSTKRREASTKNASSPTRNRVALHNTRSGLNSGTEILVSEDVHRRAKKALRRLDFKSRAALRESGDTLKFYSVSGGLGTKRRVSLPAPLMAGPLSPPATRLEAFSATAIAYLNMGVQAVDELDKDMAPFISHRAIISLRVKAKSAQAEVMAIQRLLMVAMPVIDPLGGVCLSTVEPLFIFNGELDAVRAALGILAAVRHANVFRSSFDRAVQPDALVVTAVSVCSGDVVLVHTTPGQFWGRCVYAARDVVHQYIPVQDDEATPIFIEHRILSLASQKEEFATLERATEIAIPSALSAAWNVVLQGSDGIRRAEDIYRFENAHSVLVVNMRGDMEFHEGESMLQFASVITQLRALVRPTFVLLGALSVTSERDNVYAVFKSATMAVMAALEVTAVLAAHNEACADKIAVAGYGIAHGPGLVQDSYSRRLHGAPLEEAYVLAEQFTERGEVLVSPAVRSSVSGAPVLSGLAFKALRGSFEGRSYEYSTVHGRLKAYKSRLPPPLLCEPPSSLTPEDEFTQLVLARAKEGSDTEKLDAEIGAKFLRRAAVVMLGIDWRGMREEAGGGSVGAAASIASVSVFYRDLNMLLQRLGGVLLDDHFIAFDSAPDAVLAAWKILQRIEEFNGSKRRDDHPPIRGLGAVVDEGEVLIVTGGGIHWGEAFDNSRRLVERRELRHNEMAVSVSAFEQANTTEAVAALPLKLQALGDGVKVYASVVEGGRST